jgi:DNA polymerase III gamma/tau subunit
MRKTITLIQRLSYVTNFVDITIEIVRDTIGEISNEMINNIIELLNQPVSNENQIKLYVFVNNLITNGYNCLFLINHLYYHYLNNDQICDNTKHRIIAKLSDADSKLNNGSIEIIQTLDFLMTINGLINNNKYEYTNNPFSVLIMV